MGAHQTGPGPPRACRWDAFSTLEICLGPPPHQQSRHGIERFRDRRQLVHGDLKVADIRPSGPPHFRQLPDEVSFHGGDRNASLRRRHKIAAISESDGLPRPGYIGSRLQKE